MYGERIHLRPPTDTISKNYFPTLHNLTPEHIDMTEIYWLFRGMAICDNAEQEIHARITPQNRTIDCLPGKDHLPKVSGVASK